MSMAICYTPAAQLRLNISLPFTTQISSWVPTHEPGSIQSQNPACPPTVDAPYIHPLVRQSMTWMNQNRLEMCPEFLGSESGCSDFNDPGWFSMSSSSVAEDKKGHQEGFTELTNGSYNRSSWKSSPRSFPPPLPSISRHDGAFIQMRSHRRNGRLVVEAVTVTSHNLLHARRLDGRLLLYFVDTEKRISDSSDTMQKEEQMKELIDISDGEKDSDVVEYQEEEEEEVEVVDRGTVVEVKVSTQKQHQSDAKVLRSSIMINKFVGGAPLSNKKGWAKQLAFSPQRKIPPATTTAVAAAVAASSFSASTSMELAGYTMSATKSKLLFTVKRRNREEMLNNMRRCSELWRPLFYWEPWCIAAAS